MYACVYAYDHCIWYMLVNVARCYAFDAVCIPSHIRITLIFI